jgi:hypothetical protein
VDFHQLTLGNVDYVEGVAAANKARGAKGFDALALAA